MDNPNRVLWVVDIVAWECSPRYVKNLVMPVSAPLSTATVTLLDQPPPWKTLERRLWF